MPEESKLEQFKRRQRELNRKVREVERLSGGAYDRKRTDAARRSREKSATGREIGPLRAVKDPDRKELCRDDLKLFCETYLAERFYWAWSPDHLKVIRLLQMTVLEGGQYAVAMPRGFGKTNLCESASLWAAVYGHRRFIVPIGATLDPHAEDIVRSLKTELESNDLLAEDFPEICQPIEALDGIAQRAKGQMLDGKHTHIVWQDAKIVLPTVAGSPASGVIIRAFGLTGAIRGTKTTTRDGRVVRPDLVLLDDPQTDDSAKSHSQNHDRMRIISGAVLGLAGKKRKIAALMPTTVIFPNDMADQFLDRNRHPEWQGQRFKMLYALPTNKELWNQYAEIRRESLRAGNRGREATEFYIDNQEAMDVGVLAAWPQCFNEDEISAVQHAMNFLIDNEKAFWAEAQNEPQAEAELSDCRQVEEADLIRKLNTIPRGTVPRECNTLTAFVDVQAECLFWAVCGWTDKFGGALVDYGVFPPQPRQVFEAGRLDQPLSARPGYERLEQRARIYKALTELVPTIMGRSWKQHEADGSMTVGQCLLDAAFETEGVHDFISRSVLKNIVKASIGRGLTCDRKPMNQYTKNPGDVVGWNWRIDAHTTGKGRFVSVSTYPWKSFFADAVLAPAGASGSFYLPGDSIHAHPLLTLHLTSEYRSSTVGTYGRVEVWKRRADRTENHWWDCCRGAAVAASVLGVQFSAAVAAGDTTPDAQPRPKANLRVEQDRKMREHQQRQAAARR